MYVWLVILRNHRHFFLFSFQLFLGMREKKRWTTPGGGQQHAMQRVGKLLSSSSCLRLSLSADQLSLGHPHLVELKFRRNNHRFQELTQEPQQLEFILRVPPPPLFLLLLLYSTLISLSCIPSLPSFSEISSSFFWLLRQHRDELSPKTSVFVQLAKTLH
jgi:hypothetical protein